MRKGGLFIIGSLASRDYLFSHFMENLYDETDEVLVIRKNELDVPHSKIKSRWRFYLKKGESLKFAAESPIELRLYSPHEIVGLLEEAGWKVSEIYDSLRDKRSFSPDAHGCTVIAEAV